MRQTHPMVRYFYDAGGASWPWMSDAHNGHWRTIPGGRRVHLTIDKCIITWGYSFLNRSINKVQRRCLFTLIIVWELVLWNFPEMPLKVRVLHTLEWASGFSLHDKARSYCSSICHCVIDWFVYQKLYVLWFRDNCLMHNLERFIVSCHGL